MAPNDAVLRMNRITFPSQFSPVPSRAASPQRPSGSGDFRQLLQNANASNPRPAINPNGAYLKRIAPADRSDRSAQPRQSTPIRELSPSEPVRDASTRRADDKQAARHSIDERSQPADRTAAPRKNRDADPARTEPDQDVQTPEEPSAAAADRSANADKPIAADETPSSPQNTTRASAKRPADAESSASGDSANAAQTLASVIVPAVAPDDVIDETPIETESSQQQEAQPIAHNISRPADDGTDASLLSAGTSINKPVPSDGSVDSSTDGDTTPTADLSATRDADATSDDAGQGDAQQDASASGEKAAKPARPGQHDAESTSTAPTAAKSVDAHTPTPASSDTHTRPEPSMTAGPAGMSSIKPDLTIAREALPPEQRFAADNTDAIVKSVQTQIQTRGDGKMEIRLDPPELGALQVSLKMVDGRMTASFTTSNDEATQMLSHSLNHLKSSLEASGIPVDRIQVRQASNDSSSSQNNNDSHNREGSAANQQQDQQRRDGVRRMWERLRYGADYVDLVA